MGQICKWTLVNEDWSTYETDCGHTFEFTNEGLKENGFRFCPYCGNSINDPSLAVGQALIDEARIAGEEKR
jgi:hypothetical protein